MVYSKNVVRRREPDALLAIPETGHDNVPQSQFANHVQVIGPAHSYIEMSELMPHDA